jgi:hypothetical protein
VERGNQPIHALILESETPNLTRVVQVPTRMQCDVSGVIQSGNNNGNKRVTINDKAVGRPLSKPTSFNKYTCGYLAKKKCKKRDRPGKEPAGKSKIRK